jgi:hypothetical protein
MAIPLMSVLTDFSALPKHQVGNAANGGYKETNERLLARITPLV